MVEGVPFPAEIFTPKALSLVAQGFFNRPKKTVMGVYLDPSDVKPYFETWKSENEDVLAGGENLYDALMSADPEMDKVIRVVVTEGTYDLYGLDLETAVKETLEGEAEKKEVDEIVKFIRSKHINAIIYHLTDTSSKIGIEIEGKEDDEIEYIRVENVGVVGALSDFCLNGVYRLSPTFEEPPQIMVEGVPFPSVIFFPPDAFLLVAQGFDNQPTNMAIGIYLPSFSVKSVFVNWKCATKKVLSGDDNIFDALFSAEMEKVIRMVVMHEVERGQYGAHLKKQMSGLRETDLLDSVVSFFDSKDLKTNSIITYYFSHQNHTCEIKIEIEGKAEEKLTVENVRLVGELYSFSFSGINRLLPEFDD